MRSANSLSRSTTLPIETGEILFIALFDEYMRVTDILALFALAAQPSEQKLGRNDMIRHPNVNLCKCIAYHICMTLPRW